MSHSDRHAHLSTGLMCKNVHCITVIVKSGKCQLTGKVAVKSNKLNTYNLPNMVTNEKGKVQDVQTLLYISFMYVYMCKATKGLEENISNS